jgi:menaquinone-dependent protoporphyrinogen oxidase
MRVLVTAASKHGATAEIASSIGSVLESAGIEAEVRSPDEVGGVNRYDGAVIGSAVYAGHWLAAAKEFVTREAAPLATKPVWLFSSGPLGDPAKPVEEPVDVPSIREQTGARDHRIFPGRLLRRELGMGERAIAAVVRAPDGDFRPWDEVMDWAAGIARTLKEV